MKSLIAMCSFILLAPVLLAATPPTPAPATPPPKPKAAQDRELHITVTVVAQQDWHKNDPEHPGAQWSKATATQTIDLRTQLRSDGVLQVRNLLDPDLNARMEAKTILLARQAKKILERPGQTLRLPTSDADRTALMNEMQERMSACNAEPACMSALNLEMSAVMAAVQYPQALEEDAAPGKYLYFLPFSGCPGRSRVTLKLAIDGIRYNKTSDSFVPFSERRNADAADTSDGLEPCQHFLAVIDTQDPMKPMRQETIYVPSPAGTSDYTEVGHTSHTAEPQPLIIPALDWVNQTLRVAPLSGHAETTVPLPLPLNANATWLGLWTGSAKITMDWSFDPVESKP